MIYNRTAGKPDQPKISGQGRNLFYSRLEEKTMLNQTISDEPVISIEDFKRKYRANGKTFFLLIEEYIRRASEFPGEGRLAKEIGIACADLESALRGK